MNHVLSVAAIVLLLAGLWIGCGWYSYHYITKWFSWPKWLVVSLCLGGLATYFIVVLDEFQHTSMGGQNTRGWKDDEENGVHILSWDEVCRLKKEGKLNVVETQREKPNDNA